MPWLVDTNHWIRLLKGRSETLVAKLRSVPPQEVWLCSVVKEELLHGALGYEKPEERLSLLAELFAQHPSAPFDDEAAEAAARVRHDLETLGQIIGPHDTQIAGIALSRGWTVVTNNTGEFGRVAGLMVEDWTAASHPAV